MTKPLFTLLSISLAAVSLHAFVGQDPVIALPESYSKQFENEWVRIIRVRYAPLAKLPAHAHNALPAAYVYLNDGGPVVFKHIGASYGTATRPATKAGGFRIFRGIAEIHEVENTSPLPSEFLRVEFKTEAKDLDTLRGRFAPEPAPAGENPEKVQFENAQVRITRVMFAAGRAVQLTTPASEPAILIALKAAQFRNAAGKDLSMRPGQEHWLAAGSTLALSNTGTATTEFLRFDFKTAPLAAPASR